MTLSFTTPRRFIPAHKEKSRHRISLSFGVPAEHFSAWLAGEAGTAVQ
jgi:hypothetical protein